MRHAAICSVIGSVAFLGACGGSSSTNPDSGAPPADTAPALSVFAPAAIEGVINAMVAAVTAQNLPASAKPPIAVLLKDTTTYWYPVTIGANRMSTRLITPFIVEAPLIVDPANITNDQKAALQNQYTQTYLTGKLYKGLAYAPQADNADTVAYLNQFIAQCGPVVTIDSDAPDSNRSYFIATANYQAGATAGNKLAEVLKPGDTVAVFGTTATGWVSGLQRAQGAEDALAAAGMVLAPRISPVFDATVDTNAIIAELSDPTLNIKGLACMYSNSSNCAAAVEALGMAGQIQIVGFDMTPDTKSYFAKGYFYGIAVQRQYYMGELGVLVPYAIDVLGVAQTAALLQPILVGTSFIDTGIDVITTANYADYNAFLSSLGINS
jgi:ribose transport system substrate-binding protein